ncbi:hypothetical protein TIFTF001_042532, partial [Ficus carica]
GDGLVHRSAKFSIVIASTSV